MAGRPFGATATVHLQSGRVLVAQEDGGGGHSGKRSPDLHFGTGEVTGREKLKVDLRWRDPDGGLHRQSLDFAPGWHTVVLGWPEPRT